MNDLNEHKKSDKIKWVFTGIAFVLVFVMLAGIFMQIFGAGKVKPSEWLKKPETEQTEPLPEDNGDVVVNQTASNGVELMSARIAPTAYAANGIDPQADSAYQITASVQPADASLQSGTFSIGFKNPSSTWASGKDINEYAEVTQNGLTANFICKKGFGEQIVLTFAADTLDNEAPVTATCTIDYCARAVYVNELFLAGKYSYLDDEGESQIDWEYALQFVGGNRTDKLTFTDYSCEWAENSAVPAYGVGSVRNSLSISSIKLRLAEDMISTVQNITGVTPTEVSAPEGKFKTYITSVIGGDFMSNTSKRNSLYSAFQSRYNVGGNALEFVITFTDSKSGVSSVVSVPVKFDANAMGVRATSAALSESALFI